MAGRQGAPNSNDFSVPEHEADLELGCSDAGDANGGHKTQPRLSSSPGTGLSSPGTRLETERVQLEAERLEAERLEAERLEAERLEAERLEAELLEAERLEAERLEAERLKEERLKAERVQQKEHIDTIQARLAVYQEKEDALEEKYHKVKEARARAARDYLGQTAPAGAGSNNLAQPTQPENPFKGNLFNLAKNLVFIENSPIHKKALEDWKGKEKLFKLRVDRKSSEVSSLKNEVYQLLGFFSVFQGVVLTAVAQSNLLHCNNQWSPITLSVLASVVTVAAIIQKLVQSNSLLNIVHTEQNCLKDVVKLQHALRREGPDFVFAQFDEPKKVEPKQDWIFWLYSGIVICFLAIFSVAFPVSYWRILCHPGSAPGAKSPSPAP